MWSTYEQSVTSAASLHSHEWWWWGGSFLMNRRAKGNKVLKTQNFKWKHIWNNPAGTTAQLSTTVSRLLKIANDLLYYLPQCFTFFLFLYLLQHDTTKCENWNNNSTHLYHFSLAKNFSLITHWSTKSLFASLKFHNKVRVNSDPS